jgi:hypothetical protein
MTQGRSLPDLTAELHRQAAAKRDFLVPARSIHAATNGHTDIVLDGAIGERFSTNDVAHGQMAEYLSIPKPFYDRLRGASTDLRVPVRDDRADTDDSVEPGNTALFDVVVNRLLASKGEDQRLVRTLDGKARAFLSDSFTVDLDNWDVFRMAAKVITEAGLGPDNVVSAEVTDRKLYLKVVSPHLEATVHPGNILPGHGLLREPQVVQAGFVLMNSETGLGSLCVQQVVYKLMCTNLWIKEEACRQRHVGKALEADDAGVVYRSDTRAADARARLLKIRDHVSEALNEERFRALVGRMQETTEITLDGSVERVVDNTARRYGLGFQEKENLLRNLIQGADLSLWGLTNAVTATARSAKSYDRATELEAIGGRMLSLTRGEVHEIATVR